MGQVRQATVSLVHPLTETTRGYQSQGSDPVEVMDCVGARRRSRGVRSRPGMESRFPRGDQPVETWANAGSIPPFTSRVRPGWYDIDRRDVSDNPLWRVPDPAEPRRGKVPVRPQSGMHSPP